MNVEVNEGEWCLDSFGTSFYTEKMFALYLAVFALLPAGGTGGHTCKLATVPAIRGTCVELLTPLDPTPHWECRAWTWSWRCELIWSENRVTCKHWECVEVRRVLLNGRRKRTNPVYFFLTLLNRRPRTKMCTCHRKHFFLSCVNNNTLCAR